MAGSCMAPAVSSGQLLDEVGEAIRWQVQGSGRRSGIVVCEAVGVSEDAVRQRGKALVESTFLQIVTMTDPVTLGFGSTANVGVSVPWDSRPATEAIRGVDDVDNCLLPSGRHDLLFEVVCRDHDKEDLLSASNDRVHTVEGVRGPETFIGLRVHR